MKKILFLLSAIVLTVLSSNADTYNYLNFVTASNQITQVGTTGLRMTFNNGKASVTAGGATQTINLATMAYMEFTNTQSGDSSLIQGDINGDGVVDITDVNLVIGLMLGTINASDYPGDANLNGDATVDITDVNLIIGIMLGKA